MSHAVLKLNHHQIEQLKNAYRASIQSNTPQGGLFVAKVEGCTITAYKSGKILFQGPSAEQESSRWQSIGTPVATKKTTKNRPKHSYLPPENISECSIIGSDEVGTGDFFGPITVVASFIPKAQLPLIKELGVKDSKTMKDPQIIEIAKNLIHTIPYSLMVLHNEKYNDLQAKGMSQGKMKAMLHQKAISNILAKLSQPSEVEGILIDQFCEPDVYFRHTNHSPTGDIPYYFETKAEGIHLSVAASSIIARYAFLNKMDELTENAGIPIPKGAGSIVDEAAAKIVFKHGEDYLRSISKTHFANTQKAMKIVNQKRNK